MSFGKNIHSAEDFLKYGIVQAEKDLFAEAIEFYNLALDLDPNFVPAIIFKGKALGSLGDHAHALELFDSALQLDPFSADALYCKALALTFLEHDVETCIELFDKTVTIDPFHAKALFNKGMLLCRIAKYIEAQRCFEKLVDLMPEHVTAWNELGLCKMETNDLTGALQCFDHALQFEQSLGETLFGMNNRGIVLGKMRRFDEALECFDTILAKACDFAPAWLNKSNVLLELGRYDEALVCCDKTLELDPDECSGAYFNKGMALEKLRHFAEAQSCFEKAMELSRNDGGRFTRG